MAHPEIWGSLDEVGSPLETTLLAPPDLHIDDLDQTLKLNESLSPKLVCSSSSSSLLPNSSNNYGTTTTTSTNNNVDLPAIPPAQPLSNPSSRYESNSLAGLDIRSSTSPVHTLELSSSISTSLIPPRNTHVFSTPFVTPPPPLPPKPKLGVSRGPPPRPPSRQLAVNYSSTSDDDTLHIIDPSAVHLSRKCHDSFNISFV